MNKVPKSAYVIGFALACGASYVIGVNVGGTGFALALESTQGELAFNHMNNYQDIFECLESGGIEGAKERARVAAIIQKDLLGEILRMNDIESLNEYIELRSEEPLAALKDYKAELRNPIELTRC